MSHIDFVPTVLDFFAVPRPDLLHGTSLLPQFQAPNRAVNDHVFIEFNRFEIDHDGFGAFAPIRCIVDAQHKLAINLLDTDEFYVRRDDPLELRNAVNDPAYAAVRERMHRQLVQWMNRTRDPLRGPHWMRRAWNGCDNHSTWGGPTRPRPFDERWMPKTLLYDSGEVVDRYEYEKS